MMRRLIACMTAVLLLVPLAACQSIIPMKKSEGLSGSLTIALYSGEGFSTIPYVAGTIDKKMPIHDRIAAFQADNPNVHIDVIDLFPGNLDIKQLIQQPEGLPDIIELNVNEVRYLMQDRVENLADRIDPVRSKWADGYAALIDSARVDGDPYLLPVRSDPMAVYYDRAVFRNYGIPVPQDNWTLSEFAAIAAKLADAGESVGIPIDLGGIEHIVSGMGGTYVSPDGRQAAGYLDSEATAQAFARYFAMMPEGHYVIGNQIGNSSLQIPAPAFGLARASVMYRPVRLTGKDYGLLPAPSPDEGPRTNTTLLTGLALTKDTQQPELAWALMEYIVGETGEEATSFVAANTLETAYRMVREEPDPRYEQLKEWMKLDYATAQPSAFDMFMGGVDKFYQNFPIQLPGTIKDYYEPSLVRSDLTQLAGHIDSWIDVWQATE